MFLLGVFGLSLSLRVVTALVFTATSPPSSTIVPVGKRAISPPLPTYTFGARSGYFPKRVSNPEPSGTSVQIYPTGIYDDFPKEGIIMAFGPDLRKQIKDTMLQSCKDKPREECRNALNPVLQNTDVTTHTKRFIAISAILLGELLIAIAAETLIIFGEGIYLHNTAEVPKEIKFDRENLAQIQSMAGAHTFAAIAGATGAPSTITYQPPPTTTATDFITIETLVADRDGKTAGDVVYRIPEHAAARIRDFLGMTGIKDTQEKCKGQSLKRAGNLQECLKRIQRHGMDLADVGPANLLQLAQRNIPARPGPGQAIGFPIQNMATNGVLLLIPVYHVVYEHAPQAPNIDQGWNPSILAKSAMGLTIAAHAAMFAGQSMLEIWVDKDKLVTNLKEEDLACPKDIICVADDCKGQEEGKNVGAMTPICTDSKRYGCKCKIVTYPHVFEVPSDYMDKQYEWLEELIKRSELPSFDPECSEGEQALTDASNKLKDVIELACNDHPELKDSWTYSDSKEGFTFGITFDKKGGNCAFDCRTMFPTFADSDSCITSSGIQKNGRIETDCGTASYVAYRLS